MALASPETNFALRVCSNSLPSLPSLSLVPIYYFSVLSGVGHSSPGRAPWEGPRGEFRALIRAGRRHRADGKGGGRRAPTGGTTDNGMHSNERGCIAVQKAGYCGTQEGGINAGQTGGTAAIFLQQFPPILRFFGELTQWQSPTCREDYGLARRHRKWKLHAITFAQFES